MSETEIEARLTELVRTMRVDCDGCLPTDFDIHLEDVARALGLSDPAIGRILGVATLPSGGAVYLYPPGPVAGDCTLI